MSVLSDTMAAGGIAVRRDAMSGQAAVRGFEYQFLRTLWCALDSLRDPAGRLMGVSVDGPPSNDPHADQEIVDFALLSESGCMLAAQVKGGVAGSMMTATEAVRVLLRLLTHTADQYELITNRRAGPGLHDLVQALQEYAAGTLTAGDLRSRMAELVSRSGEIQRAVFAAGETWFERLRYAKIVLDNRTVDELYEDVRERVRAMRHHLDPAGVGWAAAGLLTGYLMSEILAKAALEDCAPISCTDLRAALCIDQDTLKSVMRYRDWSVHVTPAPRGADIARPGLLEQIARELPTPVCGDSVPVCVLTGLSGIGKTSVAAAWADDRADAYAAVIWVEAATTAQLEASFATAAAWFGEDGAQGTGDSAREKLFAALARTARPWLMVFDNAASLQHLRNWIPPRGNGHVLVTTLDPTSISGPRVTAVPVGVMIEDEAVRLLTRRLIPDRVPTRTEVAALSRLAEQLLCWPLALELAAAYLKDCYNGLAGIGAYQRLMMRSLDDEASVPLGYPRPLVQAIILAWRRMCDQPGDAEKLATIVLRFAAFVAPRQIPLHLMLVCHFVAPQDIIRSRDLQSIYAYFGDDPPVGEIVRALRRQSLVVPDADLFSGEAEDGNSPDSTGYTIAVNEIVQTILLEEITREGEGLLSGALSTVAFHIQHWISLFTNTEQINLAFAMSGHAITVAEHALQLGVDDLNVALLLGNTARVLEMADHSAEAARYLRAELNILDRSNQAHPLLRLQTSAALAASIFNATDRPREVADQVADALEGCLCDVDRACAQDEYKTAHTLRMAVATVCNLIDGGAGTKRILTIKLVLEQYCAMVPLTGKVDFPQEMSDLNALILDGRYQDALKRIDNLLPSADLILFERSQLLRLRVECLIWLDEWEQAHAQAHPFVQAASDDELRAVDAAHFARNVGIATLAKIKIGERSAEAVELFKMAVAVADHFENHGHALQVHDRSVIEIFRAIRAFLAQDAATCRDCLTRVDLQALAIADSRGIHRAAHRLLDRWISLVPQWSAAIPANDSGADRDLETWSSLTIPGVPVDAVLDQTKVAQPETTMLMAVELTQTRRAGGRSAADPTEVVFVLCQALQLMGFEAEVVATTFTVTSESLDKEVELLIARRPHHIVWLSPYTV